MQKLYGPEFVFYNVHCLIYLPENGNTFCVYNVHGLLHLHECVKFFDCSLDNVSEFSIENYLGSIKRTVKNANIPICQVVKKLTEMEKCSKLLQTSKDHSFVVSCRERDSCFYLKDNLYFIKEKRDEYFLCNIISKTDMNTIFLKSLALQKFIIYYIVLLNKHLQEGQNL